MTVAPVYASYVPTYASREPYITVDEFLAAPTGTDVTQLVPGASPAANRDALKGVILRSSSECDVFCQQVLAATLDTQVAPPEGWRVIRRGGRTSLMVPVDYTPVVCVTGVSLGTDPSNVTALTDLTGVWPSRKIVSIPVASGGITNPPTGAVPGSGPSWPVGAWDRRWGTVSYVNGFFNATLTGAVVAGATAITPSDVLGLYPGLSFTIYDSLFASSETCQVAAGYTPGAATVPLSAPLSYAHAAGTSVSALPPAVRQAVISLTSALIKRRGGEAIMLQSIRDEPSRVEQGEPGMSSDEQHAYALLKPFRRVR